MIREKINVSDFDRITRENEFFIWNFTHFTESLQIKSIFQPEHPFLPNALIGILDTIPVPYFESVIEDSYDFLINLDTPFIKNITKNGFFQPVMISFNRKRMVNHTYGPYCYCTEGIIELIGELNPQFILDSN